MRSSEDHLDAQGWVRQKWNIGEFEFHSLRLDSQDENFPVNFAKYKDNFLSLLGQAYAPYFGDDYHLDRITAGRAILYLLLRSETVVGASYVKRNLRRGGTMIYPPEFRRLGLGKILVSLSFGDFPRQYSILEFYNEPMIRLLLSLNFVRAQTKEQVLSVCNEDHDSLTEFEETPAGVTFSRKSDRRISVRERVVLLHRGYNNG